MKEVALSETISFTDSSSDTRVKEVATFRDNRLDRCSSCIPVLNTQAISETLTLTDTVAEVHAQRSGNLRNINSDRHYS